MKWEGVGGLYKGVGSPLVGQMFFRSVMFTSYGQSIAYLEKLSKARNETVMHLKWFYLAGAVTGGSTALLEGPIDLFKSQVQVEIIQTKKTGAEPKYRNVFHCAKVIYKEYGIRGCYQGLSATLIRNTPASASYFFTNEWTRRFLLARKKSDKLSNVELLAGGGAAGLVYWTSTFPLDVIKVNFFRFSFILRMLICLLASLPCKAMRPIKRTENTMASLIA